jgi:DNA-binding CsgD family transcriptional regulator
LLDWLAAESRAADFPTNASFSPLVSWQVLSDQIQEGEVASPVVATWVEAWQYFGAKAFMRLRFPIVAGRSFEVFLFCRADRLDRSTQSMLVWSALSLWPNIKRLIASAISPLSRRELQCLQLSFEGLSAYKVGLRLGITDRTVNFHIANAMAKLKAQNKLEAVRRACWLGVL